MQAEDQLRETAFQACWTAIENEDSNQFRDELQKSLVHLSDANIKTLLQRTIIKSWADGTRCLLEQGADPKFVSLIILAKTCTSLPIFQLLADVGMNFKHPEENILVYE